MGKSKYIITINRQFGSMGRPIAKIVAEKLGIEFYDREIIDKAANELNLPASVIEEQEESASLPVKTFSRMMFPLGKGASDTQDKIFDAQQRIIKFLAEKENCVIVGRCSDFILDEFDNVMHVYIYAPYKERLKNSIEELGLSEKEAKKMMKAVDEARDDYQMHYAGYHSDDKNHKDIMIDSSFLGIEGTADYIVEAVKRKFGLE